MKDFKKFCRPKTTKHPKPGDYKVTLNCGGSVYVEKNEFENKASKYFKKYLVVLDNHDYSQDYLTFVALSQGTITIHYDEVDGSPTTISYSIDDGDNWSEITTTTEPYTITTLNVGEKVLLKGNNSSYYLSAMIRGTATFEVCGNIMSLIYGDNFVGQTTLTEGYTFNSFFMGNTSLISAENLVLPATTLAQRCYTSMFKGCTSLTAAPELPATTLAEGCYEQMFSNCTSLTTAPELPATTLTQYCYQDMFEGCTSLTTAPVLSATTLANYCYSWMFRDCTSLTTAPVLSATTLVESCYYGMLERCTSLTTAPELPATTLASQCYMYMFEGCTSLTTAPELPATTLVQSCYDSMFYGCTNLNSITCLATDISEESGTYEWVKNVASSGTFTKAASMASWTTGNNGIPTGWIVEEI